MLSNINTTSRTTPSRDHILLLHDGSPSAARAGELAVSLAAAMQLALHIVFHLGHNWTRLLGDEWLSNASTRREFWCWLEEDLLVQARAIMSPLEEQAEQIGVAVRTEIITGHPEQKLVELVNSSRTALLVLPHPRSRPPAPFRPLQLDIRAVIDKVDCAVVIGPAAAGQRNPAELLKKEIKKQVRC
ncbi:MAG: universal stress protein [Desulfurispora sp.]|uniref:universal stress protein n=1 Tax=Desulfurispora sp. TaxID=3014275 RepID=UPI00404AE311